MDLKKHVDLRRKEVKFGIIWGIVGFILGSLIVEVLATITKIIDILVQALFWIILLPAKLIVLMHETTGIANTWVDFALALLVGLVLGPFVYKVFVFIRDVIKKSPI